MNLIRIHNRAAHSIHKVWGLPRQFSIVYLIINWTYKRYQNPEPAETIRDYLKLSKSRPTHPGCKWPGVRHKRFGNISMS